MKNWSDDAFAGGAVSMAVNVMRWIGERIEAVKNN